MSLTEPLTTTRAAAYIALIFGLFALIQWHDEYTERRIAEREYVERQQRIEAVRAMDCGVSPVYLAQGPGEAK